MAKTTIEVGGEDVETGNTYDKYASKNPIEQKMMDGFFAALDRLTPEKVLFSFESSHPPPQLRMPIVSQTANTFRMTGGNGLPIPFTF